MFKNFPGVWWDIKFTTKCPSTQTIYTVLGNIQT